MRPHARTAWARIQPEFLTTERTEDTEATSSRQWDKQTDSEKVVRESHTFAVNS